MNTFGEDLPLRAKQKERTRAAVLAAARALFAQHGFERTTIRDVAARAGVAVGTVFVHFPDKNVLLAATLDAQIASTLSRAWSTLPEGSAREQLRHVIGALYRMYARSPALARVLIKESLFLEGPGKPAAEARLGEFLQALTAVLSRSGVLRTGLDASDAASAVFAAYLACLVEGLSSARFEPKRQLARFDRLIEPWFATPRANRKESKR